MKFIKILAVLSIFISCSIVNAEPVTSAANLEFTKDKQLKYGIVQHAEDIPPKVVDALNYLTESKFKDLQKSFSREENELKALGVKINTKKRGFFLLDEYLVFFNRNYSIDFGIPLNAITLDRDGVAYCTGKSPCIQDYTMTHNQYWIDIMSMQSTDNGTYNALIQIQNYVNKRYGVWKPKFQTDSFGGQKQIINVPNPNWKFDKK